MSAAPTTAFSVAFIKERSMPAHHGSPWLEREDSGKVTIVRLKTPKTVDDEVIRLIFDPIYALTGVGRNHLLLNLQAVRFLPSAALGKLIMLNRRVEASQGRLALCALTPDVREVLTTTHLDDMFNIYATEAEALQSFAGE
jgi:anti-sigma B factor antagonist